MPSIKIFTNNRPVIVPDQKRSGIDMTQGPALPFPGIPQAVRYIMNIINGAVAVAMLVS
jgi:hypothetical protein